MTRITLEAPGGLVEVVATCRDGKCLGVKFANVPCFVFGLDKMIEVRGVGTLKTDITYGGMIYVMVDAQALGFAIAPDEARDMVVMGEKIKAAAAEQFSAVHPLLPEIHTINQALFAGPIINTPAGKRSRNGVIVSPGRLDRCPCGTGTSARLAAMYARKQIAIGETFIHESIIGSEFTGRIEEELMITDTLPGIRPSIFGQAWLTGFYQYILDRTDPFPIGYTLSDIWHKNTSS